jgi:predicted nucleic acid-binding protein
MYLDSAYIAKYYLNESDSPAVRAAIRGADSLISSEWSVIEVACAFHRHMREGELSARQFQDLMQVFLKHCEAELWTLIPVGDRLLRRMSASLRILPAGIYLRAGDAIQLMSAQASGEREVWTSDRHMLAAAPHFGLLGRTAS